MMHWTSNLLICSLASLLLIESAQAGKYETSKGGGSSVKKLTFRVHASPSGASLRGNYVDSSKSVQIMPAKGELHSMLLDNGNKPTTADYNNNNKDTSLPANLYKSMDNLLALSDNSLAGNQLGYDNDNGYNQPSEPIRAAVKSRHTFDYKNVQIEPLQISPRMILVEASSVPLSILFQTKSTALNLQNEHVPSKGSVQETHSEDEPHRLIHNVYRRIIQEINEIVQPYRVLNQRVEPVIETVKTIISKAAPKTVNNENTYHHHHQQQQQQQESYGTNKNKLEQSYVSEDSGERNGEDLSNHVTPSPFPSTAFDDFDSQRDVSVPTSSPAQSMPQAQALAQSQLFDVPQQAQQQYEESEKQSLKSSHRSPQFDIPQQSQQQYEESQKQQLKSSHRSLQFDIPQQQQNQFEVSHQVQQQPETQSRKQQSFQQKSLEIFQKKFNDANMAPKKSSLKRKNHSNLQRIKSQKQLQMFMDEHTMKSAAIKAEPAAKPQAESPAAAVSQPLEESNEALQLPDAVSNRVESLPLIQPPDLENDRPKSAKLSSVPAVDDIGIGEEMEVQPQHAASTETSVVSLMATDKRPRHQKRSEPVIMFYSGGSIPRLIAAAVQSNNYNRNLMKQLNLAPPNDRLPTEY